MAKLGLRVSDMNSGDRSVIEFDDEERALAWLKARPRFTEVLGVADMALVGEVNDRLRAAMRPLDPEERELEKQLEAKLEAEARAKNELEKVREKEKAEAHRAAMATAHPDRVMEVHFRYDRDLELTDAADLRPITPEARDAVLAWVRERDEWVAGRGQVVGDAKVTVWPGPLPKEAGGERVKMGTFVPVTAAAKSEDASS